MSILSEPYGIHWFRRDLRIPGNEGLRENYKKCNGRTLGLFCFDASFLGRNDFSHNRFAFFIKTLQELKHDLKLHGGDLLVVDAKPEDTFLQLIHFLTSHDLPQPKLISWNRDYEPYARARDSKVESLIKSHGIKVTHHRDHLLFEPHEILKSESLSDYYKIYSPYSKKWFQKLDSDEVIERLKMHKGMNKYFKDQNKSSDIFRMNWTEFSNRHNFPFADSLERFKKENEKNVTVKIPDAGFYNAYQRLIHFKSKVNNYLNQRDIPSLQGTSQLSIYLKNGSLTVPQILSELNLDNLDWHQKSGSTQFVKELAWREFYYSILYHHPEVEHKCFHEQYENILWENNLEFFERWKNGTTGYPIVDAGMRELNETGWMHNRVRMIVASFLTKDLLIDWKWGERYFMNTLLDGDLAPNNGGWQWAASTGCDPQPYFRIFNPWLQGAKFDPKGLYIKKYVKELSSAPEKFLHHPEADRSKWNYPQPIVDHSLQRVRALKMYKGQ